jgi:hypothetical protein
LLLRKVIQSTGLHCLAPSGSSLGRLSVSYWIFVTAFIAFVPQTLKIVNINKKPGLVTPALFTRVFFN